MTEPLRVAGRGVGLERGGRQVLCGVDLTVEPGETVALLGRSGSGKTSLLRLVNGMLLPGSGSLQVGGRETRDWDGIALRRRIGYVVQEGGLLPHLTVEENAALVPRLSGRREMERARQWLEEVGLDPARYGRRYPRELSGGERQRVGVARALCGDPGLLLFDEPFGALDPLTRRNLQDLFLGLREKLGLGSVFVTHDVREAVRVATRIVLLSGGVAAFAGTPGELRGCGHPEAAPFLRELES